MSHIRHSILCALQDQLVAAGDRERELQRQLLQAQLQQEAHTDAIAAQDIDPGVALMPWSASRGHLGGDALLKVVTEQRDTANAAYADATERLSAKEAEIQLLRHHIRQLRGSNADAMKSSGERGSQLGRGGAAGVPAGKFVGPGAGISAHPGPWSAQHIYAGAKQALAGSKQDDVSTSGELPVEDSGLLGESSAPELGTSGVLSPLHDLPPTPGSGASYWLGASGASQYAKPPPGNDLSRSLDDADVRLQSPRAAHHAAAFLQSKLPESKFAGRQAMDVDLTEGPHKSPRGKVGFTTAGSGGGIVPDIPSLPLPRRSMTPPPISSVIRSMDQDQQRDRDQLRLALAAADMQNDRLGAIIATMRSEMESLHLASRPDGSNVVKGHDAQTVPPGSMADVAVLRAELAASDDELAHALQHVRVLQGQLQSSGQQDELQYLRQVGVHARCILLL